MSERKVENTETTTEQTDVNVDSADTGADVKVSTEKTVEQSSDESSSDTQSDNASTDRPESNVNVKVENNMPPAQPLTQRDSNKNYEAAQPIVDPVV